MSCFSIVIPVFNTKLNQFKECIDSIIGCDLNLLKEIIVIDDGSEMQYFQSLKDFINTSYKYNLIRLIRSQDHRGPAYARKTGFLNSAGEYVIFIDSDDIVIDDKFLNKLNDYFNSNQISFVRYSFKSFKDGTKPIRNIIEPKARIRIFDNSVIFEKSFYNSMVWLFAFKRKDISNFSDLFNTLDYPYEDLYFSSVLASKNLLYLETNEVFIGYRFNNPNSFLWKIHFDKSKSNEPKFYVDKWFIAFRDYKFDTSVQSYECWTGWCLNFIISNGYRNTQKILFNCPTKKDIFDFLVKYPNVCKKNSLKRMILVSILKSKILDLFLPKVICFLMKNKKFKG